MFVCTVCESRYLFPLFLLAYYLIISFLFCFFYSVEFLHLLLLPVNFLTQTTPLNYAGLEEGGIGSGGGVIVLLGCNKNNRHFAPTRAHRHGQEFWFRGAGCGCARTVRVVAGPWPSQTCPNQGLRRNFSDDPRSTSCMAGFIHAIPGRMSSHLVRYDCGSCLSSICY